MTRLPFCTTKEQIFKTEKVYYDLATMMETDLVEKTGCPYPCSYYQYRLVDTPAIISGFGFDLRFGNTKATEQKEVFLYGFVSFVSEFGGSLGLFLGLSFLSAWDLIDFFLPFCIKKSRNK